MSAEALAAEISQDSEPKTSGRLQRSEHPKAWRSLTRDPWIRRITEQGLKIHMDKTKLKRRKGEPRPLAWNNPSPLQKEWQDKVLAWNAIEPVKEEDPDQIIHNLVAAETGRICSNTSAINKASKAMKIKMESVAALRKRIKKNHWILQLDMSKYYWTMQIHPDHRKYFRFRIGEELWQWTVMPFGFVNAMQIMKRLMDVVQKKLRSWGIDSTAWVDDMVLFLGPDKERAEQLALKAIRLLKRVGFIINPDKTMRKVAKKFTFRGFDWSTEDYTIEIPASRLADIRRQARRTKDQVSPRALACLIGKIRYAANVDQNIIARVVELEIAKKEMLSSSKNWDKSHQLPPPAKKERDFWIGTKDTRPTPIVTDWSKAEIAQGDAGPLGYGYIGKKGERAGVWTNDQAQRSTNHRETEVRAIYNKENIEFMAPLQVFQTDSTVHADVAKRIYTKSKELSRQTAQIVIALEKQGIRQKVVRISQEEIKRSDQLSRIRDETDITLSVKAYNTLCKKWRIFPTIDLFASRFSKKNKRFFNASGLDTSAIAHDAFSQIWKDETIYAFPPPKKAIRAFQKWVESDQVIQAIFVIPNDPTLAAFPLIADDSIRSVLIPETEIHRPFTKRRQTQKRSRFRAFLLQKEPFRAPSQ